MKKISTLVLALVALSFSSCSSDDNQNSDTASIVGKWEFSQEGEVVNGVETLQDYHHTIGCGKDNLEFLANGNFNDEYFEKPGNVCETHKSLGTWSQNGSALTTTNGGEDPVPQTSEIVILNSTTLKIKSVYVEDGQTYTGISVFKR